MKSTFKLVNALDKSLLCIGLDPLGVDKESIFAHNKAIVDETFDLVCAYKPQIAHYSAIGAEIELERTIDYIHTNYPDIPVILDAKRGDISSTNEMYAREVFGRYNADAVTVNPYLGLEDLDPFFERDDRFVFVLCRTSNPGATFVQDQVVEGKPLYLRIAERVNFLKRTGVGLVIGATAPTALSNIRAVVGDSMPLLVPGLGVQGGDLNATMAAGKDKLILSFSRQWYEGLGEPRTDFRVTALALKNQIEESRRLREVSA